MAWYDTFFTSVNEICNPFPIENKRFAFVRQYRAFLCKTVRKAWKSLRHRYENSTKPGRACVLTAKLLGLRPFGPPHAVSSSESTEFLRTNAQSQDKERAAQVAALAACSASFRAGKKRARQRRPGVCLSSQRMRRWSAGSGTPLFAAVFAGFGGNSHCPIRLIAPVSKSNPFVTCADCAAYTRRGISFDGAEIRQINGRPYLGRGRPRRENPFSCVKNISSVLSSFTEVPRA